MPRGLRMDNLTHTLAGVLVGATLSTLAPAGRAALPARERRGLVFTLAIVCSNLPDADVLYTMAARHRLDYLSQHRGYTHTILGALVAAALVMLAVDLWTRWRRVPLTRGESGLVLATITVSLLLHVALDFTNSYGVHPFWPVDSRWFYGDAVFIIEPLLWACCAPLVFLLRRRAARAFVAVVLLAAVALAFGTRWVLPASGSAVALLASALLVVGWKAPPRVALASAIGAWCAVTLVFFAASHVAAGRVAAAFAQDHPGARLLDHVLSPLPANPLCWDAITVSVEGDRYALRRAVLSTAPRVLDVARCPDRTPEAGTAAPMRRLPAGHSAAIRWIDEYSAPRAALVRIVQDSCDASTFMRFARAPWVASRGGLDVIGDLRYDGFATLPLPTLSPVCTTRTPPWTPPRQDLLRGP